MGTLYEALQLILQVVWFIMIVHIIMSWLINFQVLRQIGDVVAEVLRHQQMPIIFEVDDQLAAAFRYPQQFSTEDERYNRSLLVEPRESR